MGKDFWADFDVIVVYSRAMALADGTLVDVTATAKEAGITCPVAVSEALWKDIETIPTGSGQDAPGRLWDVLYMFTRAAGEAKGDTILYELIMPITPRLQCGG